MDRSPRTESIKGGENNVGKKQNGNRQRRHSCGAATMQKGQLPPRYYVRQIWKDDVIDTVTKFSSTNIVSAAMCVRA